MSAPLFKLVRFHERKGGLDVTSCTVTSAIWDLRSFLGPMYVGNNQHLPILPD